MTASLQRSVTVWMKALPNEPVPPVSRIVDPDRSRPSSWEERFTV